MTEQRLPPIAITAYGVVSIRRVATPRAEEDLPIHQTPVLRPPRQVVAPRWRRAEDGQLEMCWLPATPAAV